MASEHLRLALAAGQMGTWEIDHVRQVRNHSLQTRAIFGWQPDEPLPWRELLSQVLPEDRPALTAAQERLRAGCDDAAVDYRIRRTDGAIRRLNVRGRVVARQANGSPARTVGIVADITERKQAEERLHQSEERHRKALEAGRLGAYDWDVAADVFHWDPRSRAVLGLGPNETLSFARMMALAHPADRSSIRAAVDRALDPEMAKPFVHEWRLIRPDGAERWMETQGQACFSGEGKNRKAYRLVGVVRDITRRKSVELALAESEARFRSTFENAAVGIAQMARDGRWREVNDRFCAITGYTRDELLGRRFQDMTYPDDLPGNEQQFRRVLTGEIGSFSCQKRYIRKDGSVVWVSTTGSLAHTPAGAPDYIVAIIEDITKAKEAEIAIQAALVASEHLRLALAAGQMGTWEVDHVRHLRQVSPKTRTIFGWKPDDPLPWSGRFGQALPEDQSALTATQDRLRAGDDEASVEYRIRRTDGEIRWLSVRGRVVKRLADGSRARTVGIVADITERKEAEEHVKLLMQEINHRARQTAGEVAPKVFAERFGQRLAGLAASHDLLARNQWRGVEIADLVSSQLAHLGELLGTRVIFEGPSLLLRASAAQALGMAVHELATNAIKYGALSHTKGVVRISWDLVADKSCFTMTWSEQDGPPPTLTRRPGFGHTVMVQMAKHALEARVHLEYGEAGVIWRLLAPAERVLGRDPVAREIQRIDT